MSSKSKSIPIGKTKLKAEIRICNNCECYSDYPHFIYKYGNKTILISLTEAKFIDYQDNIDLAARDDIEIFFSTINKKYKMTNWEVVKKVWNENNNKQIPKHSHKPYYRNLVENVDYANISFGNKDKLLEGGRVYCSTEVEQEPHFHYELADGTDVAISFLEPEYLYPIKRKLTEKEIYNLITFFKADMPEHRCKCTNWEYAIFSWNNQNCYSDKESIYPPYKELEDNLQMPDYRMLNKEQ